MAELSGHVTERSRKNLALVLRRLASVGQAAVAGQIGVSEATVSRLKDGDIERFSMFLAALGLKVVPVEMKCYQEDHINAILTLARQSLNRAHSAAELFTDDDFK